MKRILVSLLLITAAIAFALVFCQVPVPPECAGKTICFFIIH